MNKPRHRKSPSKSQTQAEPRQTLRIIGGQWRGRKLPFIGAEGLRPTGDRIRETLFNWLMPDLPGARCLDVFSGSGALGLEALSRGAESSTLLEINPQAATQIRQNLALLQSDQGQVVQTDSLKWLQQHNDGSPYDVIFLDPPFQQDLWQAAIEALEQNSWLSGNAAIYIETPKSASLMTPPHWHLHREKQTGGVCYRLFYRDTASPEA